ncbi:hypothetical protein [Profundibacter sp.]
MQVSIIEQVESTHLPDLADMDIGHPFTPDAQLGEASMQAGAFAKAAK